MAASITRSSACPFLRLNTGRQNASYLVNFGGECPFLTFANSTPIFANNSAPQAATIARGIANHSAASFATSTSPSVELSPEFAAVVQRSVEQEMVNHNAPAASKCPRFRLPHSGVRVELPQKHAFITPESPRATNSVMAKYNKQFEQSLEGVKKEGRYRVFAEIERKAGQFPAAVLHRPDGALQPITMWCSNDYLGQGQNPAVVGAFKDAIDKNGAGAGGTRNISGTSHHHVALERELADLHQTEGALLFSSGYVANEATISTIAKLLPGMVIFSDKLNHASLISGIKSSGCEKHVFRNNDVDHLHELLKQYPKETPKLIVCESVYSMEGSIGPLRAICDVADDHNALTLVDEVHAVGLYGATGAGIAERDGIQDRVSIISGTLAKGFGVGGGYIASSAPLVDAVRSFASSFIFTTSLNPPMAAAAKASVAYLKQHNELRVKHQERAASLKALLQANGLPVMPSETHIVPVFVGDAAKCKRISDELLYNHHIYAQPINYPTVPKGEERLRLTPTPFHTDKMMAQLVASLKTVMQAHDMPKTSAAFSSYLAKHHHLPKVATAVHQLPALHH